MAVESRDDFTRAGTTNLVDHTPTGADAGVAWTKLSSFNDDVIVVTGGYCALQYDAPVFAGLTKAGGYSSADYRVTGNLRFDASLTEAFLYYGIAARGASGWGGYSLFWTTNMSFYGGAGAAGIVLAKGGGGDWAGLAFQSYAFDASAALVLSLEVDGTTIKGSINGTPTFSETDATYSATGLPGLTGYSSGGEIMTDLVCEEIIVESLVPTGTEHSPANLGVAGSLQPASLTQDHVLSPASLGVAAGLGATGIMQAGELAPASLAVAASLEGATLTQAHILSPAGLGVSVALETTGVTDEAPPQTLAGDDFTSGSEDDDLGGRTPSGPNVGDATTWEAIMGPAGGFQKTDGDSIAYRNASYNPALQVLNRTGGYPEDGQVGIDVEFQGLALGYAIGVVMRVGASGYATGYCLVVYRTILFEGVRLMRGQGLSTWEWDVLDEWAVAHPENETWTLRLEIEGESLNGYVNDVLRVSAMDDEYTAGRSGVVGLSDGDHYNYGVHLTNYLAESLAGAETVLSPADLSVGASLEASSIEQAHVLAPASLGVAAAVEATSVEQNHVLDPADLAVAASLEAATAEQDHTLAPADLSGAVTLEGTGLAQGHAITPADLGVAASVETSSLAQVHVLDPADVGVSAALEVTGIAQAGELAPADMAVSAALEGTSLAQNHVLSPDDAGVGTALEGTGVSQSGELSPADLSVAASLETASLAQDHVLAPDDLAVPVALEETGVAQAGELTPDSLAVAALLESVALTQVHVFTPDDLGISGALDAATIDSDAYALAPDGMGVTALLEAPSLAQLHALSAADLAVAASLAATDIRFATPPYRASLTVTSQRPSLTVTARSASITVTDA